MVDRTQQIARFPDRVRLPVAFDPGRLRQDLRQIADGGWIDHLVKQNYDGAWDVLPLRIVAGATHPVMMIYADPTATAFEDGPLLDHTPYFRKVLATFGCPLQTVRLMRLGPGSTIKEHSDFDLSFEQGAARIHIPVVTNERVEFLLNGRPLNMDVGSAWYLRLSDPHSVTNHGDTDRVHLVIDCLADSWLEGALKAGLRRFDENRL